MKHNKIICKLCGEIYPYKNGRFTSHLINIHGINKEKYILSTVYNNIVPKCNCGICDEDAEFDNRLNDFRKYNLHHTEFNTKKLNYINKYGLPICCECKQTHTNFTRGNPNKYCSSNCQHKQNYWNQVQVKKTIQAKYNCDNVSNLVSVKNTISKKNKINYQYNKVEIISKRKNTNLNRHGNENYTNLEKSKQTLLDRYGVISPYHVHNNGRYYSQVSQELFWAIYNLLPVTLQSKCYFAELNKEFNIKYNTKIYCYDFIISNIKYAVEFNGDKFHANPILYGEYDTPNPFNKKLLAKDIWEYDAEKINGLKSRNYIIDIIWESDYYKNKNTVIDLILLNIKNILN